MVRREAVEEAGCTIRELIEIGPILTTPGGSSETVFLYLGYVEPRRAAVCTACADEHEDICVLVASPDEVWRWMDEGRIVNGPALVGLQWFRIHQAPLPPEGPRTLPNEPQAHPASTATVANDGADEPCHCKPPQFALADVLHQVRAEGDKAGAARVDAPTDRRCRCCRGRRDRAPAPVRPDSPPRAPDAGTGSSGGLCRMS